MNNQELFKQAIADAKSVRDAAVANAKAALEETFTPKIMSMLSAKLNEMEEEAPEEENIDEYGDEHPVSTKDALNKSDETDLDEILAQLEEEAALEEGFDISETDDADADDELDEAKKDEEKEEKKDEEEESEGDDEVTELTVDELKDIIRDVLKDVMGDTAPEADHAEPDADNAGGPSDEDADNEDEDSIDLDELLAELEKEEGEKVEESKDNDEDDLAEAKKDKKDLEEAIKTIKHLQRELNEVNLLNAKLLYTNKIFKAKTLSESQKVNVLKAFDRAGNVKEVKNVYNTLSESFNSKPKNPIRESVGFASKALGVAPKQSIVESDSAVRRMQQLAGIIK